MLCKLIVKYPDRFMYFDDIQVEHTGGMIVQEQHQYAYGSPLTGLNYVVGSKRYRHGYQGQYAERDEQTGYESFELRLYNSRLGRWTSYDPYGQFHSPYVGMGNNPVSGTDPDGGWQGGPVQAAQTAQTALNGGVLGEVVITGARYVPHITPAMTNALVMSVRAWETQRQAERELQGAPGYQEFLKQYRWATQGDGIKPFYWEHNFMPLPKFGLLKPVTTLSGAVAQQAARSAASTAEKTALRRVGKYLESVDDVFANPGLLKGKSPLEVQALLGKTKGWQVEKLGKGAHKGQGMILREYGTKGSTGRMIQRHPGGGHHGANPYWKVSSGTGTFRIF